MGMRLRAILLVSLCVLAAAPPAFALLPQTGVRTMRATEVEPTAAPGYLAWSQNSLARPNHFDAFVKAGSAVPRRINPSGTQGFLWGGGIEGDTLVYSQFVRGVADLKLYDLATGTRSSPAGVNSRYSENGASLSSGWLLFRRTNFATSTERIILHDRNGIEPDRELAVGSGRAYAQPGTVAWPWATWFRCPNFARCQAWLYNIQTQVPTAVPNPNGRSQYAVSVTEDGTLYFAEAGNANCGANRGLWQFRLGTGRKLLFRFGTNQDPAVTSPRLNADGSTTVLYDRYNCNSGAADIYRVLVPGRSDLAAQKSADDTTVNKGADVTFTISVTNDGPTTAKNVTVTDSIPTGMSFLSADASCTESTGTVTCALGNVAVGASSSATIVMRADCARLLTNTATVESSWTDPVSVDNSAFVEVDVSGSGC
jgi:uncharacterized repeat protein (TIGR01451 family)